MTSLPSRVESGTATPEEVARALGWCQGAGTILRLAWQRSEPIAGLFICRELEEPPDYLADLNLVVAECGQRGFEWRGGSNTTCSVYDPAKDEIVGQGYRPGDTAASLLAALLRAVEATK